MHVLPGTYNKNQPQNSPSTPPWKHIAGLWSGSYLRRAAIRYTHSSAATSKPTITLDQPSLTVAEE
jgi:hypothetical protein